MNAYDTDTFQLRQFALKNNWHFQFYLADNFPVKNSGRRKFGTCSIATLPYRFSKNENDPTNTLYITLQIPKIRRAFHKSWRGN